MPDDDQLRLGGDAGLQQRPGLGDDDGVDRQSGAGWADGAHDVHERHRRRQRVRDQSRLPIDGLCLEHEHEHEDENESDFYRKSNALSLALSLSLWSSFSASPYFRWGFSISHFRRRDAFVFPPSHHPAMNKTRAPAPPEKPRRMGIH